MTAVEQEHPRWQHRKGDRYLAMVSRWVGNPEAGYGTVLHPGAKLHDAIRPAELEGCRMADGTDDFNVLAYRDGRLHATLWMGEVVENDPDELATYYADWLSS